MRSAKSRPHHRRLIADLDHLRQPVRDRGEPLQNVLLEAVLQDLRRGGAADGPDIQRLGLEQRGVRVRLALGLDHPFAGAGVGAVGLTFAGGVDLGLVGCYLGADRRARLA